MPGTIKTYKKKKPISTNLSYFSVKSSIYGTDKYSLTGIIAQMCNVSSLTYAQTIPNINTCVALGLWTYVTYVSSDSVCIPCLPDYYDACVSAINTFGNVTSYPGRSLVINTGYRSATLKLVPTRNGAGVAPYWYGTLTLL